MNKTTVIITGHSQGLGAALAATWLARGAHVIGIARSSNDALQAQYPAQLRQITLDLADSSAVHHWLHHDADWATWLHGQHMLWLFNNAGTVAPSAILGKQGAADIAHAVALNVAAPLMLADAVAAQRSTTLSCAIVHISSGAAHKAYPGWSIYGACKAALDQHARNAAAEHNGIAIVSIAPGVVDTAMQESLRHNAQFPIRERFSDLYHHKQLQSPVETAECVINYCIGKDFARKAVVDIRNL